jgi:hypothetical protein
MKEVRLKCQELIREKSAKHAKEKSEMKEKFKAEMLASKQPTAAQIREREKNRYDKIKRKMKMVQNPAILAHIYASRSNGFLSKGKASLIPKRGSDEHTSIREETMRLLQQWGTETDEKGRVIGGNIPADARIDLKPEEIKFRDYYEKKMAAEKEKRDHPEPKEPKAPKAASVPTGAKRKKAAAAPVAKSTGLPRPKKKTVAPVADSTEVDAAITDKPNDANQEEKTNDIQEVVSES